MKRPYRNLLRWFGPSCADRAYRNPARERGCRPAPELLEDRCCPSADEFFPIPIVVPNDFSSNFGHVRVGDLIRADITLRSSDAEEGSINVTLQSSGGYVDSVRVPVSTTSSSSFSR